MSDPITIMIAEDQNLVRKGIIGLIEGESNIKVIGEANNGKELIDLLKSIQPEIVLLDIQMPVMNGREALEIIQKRFPAVKVIILSVYNEQAFVSEFMSLGACAYLPKGCEIETLLDAIITVKNEGIYFNTEISKALLKDLKKEKSIHPIFSELSLTEREKDVLKQLCDGKTNKEIAEAFRLTPNTIDFHRKNLYSKTKSRNLADLVKYALRHGFISIS